MLYGLQWGEAIKGLTEEGDVEGGQAEKAPGYGETWKAVVRITFEEMVKSW